MSHSNLVCHKLARYSYVYNDYTATITEIAGTDWFEVELNFLYNNGNGYVGPLNECKAFVLDALEVLMYLNN